MKKLVATLSVGVFVIALIAACQQAKDKADQTGTNESMDSTQEKMAKVSYTSLCILK